MKRKKIVVRTHSTNTRNKDFIENYIPQRYRYAKTGLYIGSLLVLFFSYLAYPFFNSNNLFAFYFADWGFIAVILCLALSVQSTKFIYFFDDKIVMGNIFQQHTFYRTDIKGFVHCQLPNTNLKKHNYWQIRIYNKDGQYFKLNPSNWSDDILVRLKKEFQELRGEESFAIKNDFIKKYKRIGIGIGLAFFFIGLYGLIFDFITGRHVHRNAFFFMIIGSSIAIYYHFFSKGYD